MFSLCTNVKSIIVDLDSLASYLHKTEFKAALTKLNQRYNLYCVSSGFFTAFPQFRTVMGDIREPLSFSNNIIVANRLDPVNTVLLAGSTSPNEIAHRFNISTIFLTENLPILLNEDNKHLPDAIVDIELLIDLLLNEKKISYFNELACEKTGGTGFVHHIGEIRHQLFPDLKANLMLAGRYFVYEDPRHYSHCLSTMISRLKNFRPYAINEMAECLEVNIQLTQEELRDEFDLITIVPAKPGCENHLDPVINHQKLNHHRSKIDSNLLFTVRHYEKQKRAGSFYDRALNVLDAFSSRRKVSGHVLLIDDVLTSGSTTMECARVLYKNGASKVTILPLSIMQSKSSAPQHKRLQDDSGTEFRLNFRNSDANPFWVASDSVFLDYEEGKKRYLNQFSYKDFELEFLF
ncbi:ComF family protein [Bacillus sp. REN3]|uniref:ComF family protein n=1 Tax=Bacillus sp. REN3 TaxID=2802440 RepID=UPI001AEE39BF|nr:ComF family protein [Bacillus sp. REN3]